MRLITYLSLLLLTVAPSARAQDTPKPPAALAGLAKALGKKASAPVDAKVFRFKPSGKPVFYDELVAAVAQNDEQKKALRQILVEGGKALEAELAKAGYPNDLSAGISAALAVCWEITTGKEVPDSASEAVL